MSEQLLLEPEGNFKRAKHGTFSKSKAFWIVITCIFLCAVLFCVLWSFTITSVNSKCPPYYQYFNSTRSCYKAITSPVTFQKALDTCKAEESRLASIHSQTENQFVQNLKKTSDFWIGYILLNGEWLWTDGSPSGFENWQDGEEHLMDNQNYSTVIQSNGKWGNVLKNQRRGFICKKEVVKSKKRRSLPYLPGYTYFKDTGFFYKLELSKKSFNDSNTSCEQENATLVSIHSAKENEFLKKLFMREFIDHVHNIDMEIEKPRPWIGLVNVNGSWQWTDGSDLDYWNWARDEPNFLSEEHRVEMITSVHDWSPKGSEWNNVQDSGKRPYFCKKSGNL